MLAFFADGLEIDLIDEVRRRLDIVITSRDVFIARVGSLPPGKRGKHTRKTTRLYTRHGLNPWVGCAACVTSFIFYPIADRPKSFEQADKIFTIGRLFDRREQRAKFRLGQKPLLKGDFLQARNLEFLPLLDEPYERGGIQQRLMSARIEPGNAATA